MKLCPLNAQLGAVMFQSAVCFAFPLNVLDCMLEAICSLECSEVMAGTFPSYLVNELYNVHVCETLG